MKDPEVQDDPFEEVRNSNTVARASRTHRGIHTQNVSATPCTAFNPDIIRVCSRVCSLH